MSNLDNMLFGNGINFVSAIDRPAHAHTPEVSDQKFSEALEMLAPQIAQVMSEINHLDDDLKMPSTVINVEIKPQYLSKSNKIFDVYKKTGLERVGSLPTNSNKSTDSNERSRIEYVRGSADSLATLIHNMSNGINVTKKLRAELIRMKKISLATIDEKLRLVPQNWESGRAYLILHPMKDKQLLLSKVQHLLPDQNPESWKTFQADDGLLYLSLILTRKEMVALAPFNALRQIMPKASNKKVQLEGDFTKEKNFLANNAYSSKNLGLQSVGQIDGGIYQDGNPYLQEIREVGHVVAPPIDFFQEHGTSVGSILLYGDLNNVVPGQRLGPESRVKSIRVLPTSPIKEGKHNVEDFDFVEAAELIKKIIPHHRDVKVWNISVGPFGSSLPDYPPMPLTVVLDQLSFKYKILFCVAVGNTGQLSGEWARIQTPADMINGLSVGSFYMNKDHQVLLAKYTSIGPGREGSVIKPDLLAHGGMENDKILTFATSNYALNQTYGTSFAAPLIARSAVQLMNANPTLSPLDTKALIIHDASLQNTDIDINRGGHGSVLNIEDVLKSANNEYRILYSSEMSTGSYVSLKIPMPDVLQSKSIEFSWTVCVLSEVSASEVEEYAQYAVEVGFYPNEEKYKYHKKGNNDIVLDNSDPEVERLLADGWKKSSWPKSNDGQKYKQLTEQSLRKKLKWDTVKNDRVNKLASSIDNPFLVLHGLSRNGQRTRIQYSVVLTVRAKNDNNLYQLVKAKYPVLTPIKNVTRNQV